MLCSTRLCFTCLRAGCKKLVDINRMDSDKITYLDKLKCFITKNMHQNETMEICLGCVKQLRVAYKFRETVLLSQETLKKHKQLNVKLEIKLTNPTDTNLNNVAKTNDTSNSDSNDYFVADLKVKSHCVKCGVEVEMVNFGEHECVANEINSPSNNIKCNSELKNPLDCERNNNAPNDMDTKENSAIKHQKKSVNRPKNYVKKTKTDISYTCDFCDLTFNKRWKLQKHVNRVHVDEKKYVCTYCNRAFKQSYHLREHITSHTGECNYTCPICDKKFQRISSQRRHMKSHEAPPGQKTKRTPFLCNICGKSFPFSNGVQRHLRIHLGIRNHECKLCNRKFTQSTHLHVHMRTHTGEKPYICDTCGEAFSLNASLQKHMTIHKNVKSAELSQSFAMQNVE